MTTPSPPSSFVLNRFMPGSGGDIVPLGSPSEPSAGTSRHDPLNVPETSDGNVYVPSSFAGVGLATKDERFDRRFPGPCSSITAVSTAGSFEPGGPPASHAASPTAPASLARSVSSIDEPVR